MDGPAWRDAVNKVPRQLLSAQYQWPSICSPRGQELINLRAVRLVLALAAIAVVFVVTLVVAFNLKDNHPDRATTCPPHEGPNALDHSPTSRNSPTLPPLTATATLTPQPTAAPVVGTLTELQNRMGQAIAQYSVNGRYAVAVTDLQTGETASINGDRRQLSGCSINLFVLLLTTLDLQQGKHAGEAVERADDLMNATTWSSNAATARELYEMAGSGDTVAGVARVEALIRELGLTSTALDHPPLYAESSLGRGDNWITANDANLALETIWAGDLLTREWRDYLLAKLAAVKPGLNYLVGSISGATVSHKNGFFQYREGFVDNDMGIVRLRRGGEEIAFAVSFLSEGVPVKYADMALGQQLMQLAFAYFSAAYE